jgi:two-component system sensor kinase FixL
MVDGVITIGPRGHIQLYNPACEKIFGYLSAEVKGKNISVLMPEPDRQNHDSYISNYQKSRKAKIIGIGRRVSGLRKNGEVFPMYLSVGENTSEALGGYVGIIRDLTEETKNAEQYSQLQEEFFHLSRVAAMNQVGTAIAHELNQPLAAVMNYIHAAQASLQGMDHTDKVMLQDIMAKSASQVERAATTLSRLRRFIQSGEIEKNAFTLRGIVASSVNLAMINFKASTIKIVQDYPDSSPLLVFGSDIQIQQVLVNLIRNACESFGSSEENTILISVEKEDNHHVKIGVIDNGEGLTDAAMDTLFKPFVSSKRNGLGVGLSISQSIINNHDGRLWAEPNPDGGSAFYFTLPLAPEKS